MTSDQKLKTKESHTQGSVISCAGGNIEIFTEIPLSYLNKESVKVFKANGKNKFSDNLVAYVCDKTLTPRHLAEPKYLKINNPNLARLAATEVANFGVDGEKFCYFYEAPVGRTLITKDDASPALGWKPEEAMLQIVNPILTVLSELRDKDLVHGEIWPGNMHFEEEKSGKHVVLGDCLSLPQSYNLPFLYEPVERALADPIGRGAGTLADDLYAFGVSLAVILRTNDPMAGATMEEIIKHKIEKGTYATLINKDRFNGATLELLRGLLYDDAAQRWTLDDITAWKDGRRLSPKQSSKRVKATRPVIFNNKKYTRLELLAKDLREKPIEATRLVEEGDLEQWIERAMEDKTIKIRVEQLLSYLKSSDRGSWYNDKLAALLATTLYPDCPVRYKKLSFNAAGFGKYFTHEYLLKEDAQAFIDILKIGLLIQIIQSLKINPVLSTLRSKFDACRNYLSQSSLGSGLERCLYTLNPETHCLSPVLTKYYVRTPEDMMRAFEDLCEHSPNASLFDRHTVSFLSVKDKKNIDPYMPDLRSPDRYHRVLGQLRVLATIQKRSNLGNFPNIANWISINLNDVYEQFHDAKKKEKFKKNVDKIKKNGELEKIAVLFDDPKLYQDDIGNFYQAVEYYKKLNEEKDALEKSLEKKTIGQNVGHYISSLISVGLSIIVILATAYFKLVVG